MFGYVMRKPQVLLYNMRTTLPYRQLSLAPCDMDVIMLMGVGSAVNRLVASKTRREFSRKAMSMCYGEVKPWGRYRITQQDRDILRDGIHYLDHVCIDR